MSEGEMAKRNENLPMDKSQADFFSDYGNQASQRNIVGKILKFNKGDYTAGMSDEPIEVGTQMIANMNTLTVGWQKWEDGKPADANMGLVMEGFQPSKRKDLGDLDEDEWETDEQSGKPRDPWQFTNMIVLRELGTAGEDDGLYTYATNSRGGINAIGALCKIYSKKIREEADALPIIGLHVDSYKHSNKQYGTIKTPVFVVVGWATTEEADDATETVVEEVVDEETGEVETKAKPKPKAIAAPKKPVVKKNDPKAGKKKTRF